MQVRVWNIPEQRVVDWADVHEMVTATAFSPDGRRAVVGDHEGPLQVLPVRAHLQAGVPGPDRCASTMCITHCAVFIPQREQDACLRLSRGMSERIRLMSILSDNTRRRHSCAV